SIVCPRYRTIECGGCRVGSKKRYLIQIQLLRRFHNIGKVAVIGFLNDASPGNANSMATCTNCFNTFRELLKRMRNAPDAVVNLGASIERDNHILAELANFVRVLLEEQSCGQQ